MRVNVVVKDLGRIAYSEALRVQFCHVQKQLEARSHSSLVKNTILLCEHPNVYTLGHRSSLRNIEDDQNRLEILGAEVHKTKRGGQITFHGPGQVVCYPIVDLRSLQISLRTFVYGLEESIIRLCLRYKVLGERSPHTGVWVGDNKICAIGLHVSRGITSHGLALNCDNDLSWFDHIVPCGIEGKGVTSLSQQTGTTVSTKEVKPLLIRSLLHQFDLQEATEC
ncbi:putative lipoyltransferase 2, mitochondrial [Corticium candelabrum]|uniref:putative lipoyltransferase 2, mitochondrial n=1 Tax=Corticium candelabrum TaxID=121492 RepID=UPI002E2733FC|nr:putative lipoyltransferase 2, mitochondrial [Corticium candelabrum]